MPATLLENALVRVRPGLPWRVVDRLAEGELVLIRHRAGDWLQIRYRDDVEGWTRASALDLGEIDWWDIAPQPAPPLIAEWRRNHYGVVGLSADGAEVRLLGSGGKIVGAPRGEVTLDDVEVTLEDLPILVGDETVVFSADDFRVGQGKILPKANEWMWLAWGWLLAHNDEYIWQWRPETDRLEFVRRPPGPARLSPDGRFLAILDLCPEDVGSCLGSRDVILLPLDGSPPLSLRRSLRQSDHVPDIQWILARRTWDLSWAPAGTALMIHVRPADHAPWWVPAIVMREDGSLTYFDFKTLPLSRDVGECNPRARNDDRSDPWHFRSDGTVAASMDCTTDVEYLQYEMVFGVGGRAPGFRARPGAHAAWLRPVRCDRDWSRCTRRGRLRAHQSYRSALDCRRT
ncbi:MAG: SH3 domain-containing protein [Chloroflexi bacterium]|nr:SH3 domain-containing protein [Chloroflexota bacterium]